MLIRILGSLRRVALATACGFLAHSTVAQPPAMAPPQPRKD